MKSFLKWTLLLTGLMPIVYSAGSLFPYIFPKAVYFRGLIFVASVAFCIACAFDVKFRDEMIGKIKRLWQSSIFRWMTFFYGSLVLSTIFAFDRFMAMFGNIEREEGFLGLFFFYIFFVLISFVFEKKDWLRFFAVTLFTGGVLFLVAVSEFFQGNTRPGSLTDNPIFLAAYFLFVIFAGIVLYKAGSKKNNVLVMSLSVFSLITSFLGEVLTQTRGVILGMFVGLIVVLIHVGFSHKNALVFKKIPIKRFLTIVFVGIGLFILVFVGTRHSSFWSHIPGLDRIALISLNDSTTKARLVNASIVLHAVNPKDASLIRSLFGWGWDNYIYAWQKFYNPTLYQFDGALFDRAHDKILDILLMTGVLGLISYFGLWISFFRETFKKGRKFSFEIAAFVFWGLAYFLQNLTVFDTLVTFITFYAMFAYLIYETRENTNTTIVK